MSEILNILVLILRKYFEVSDVPLTPRNRWVAQGLSCEKKDTLIFFNIRDNCHIRTKDNNVIHINKKGDYAIRFSLLKKRGVVLTLSKWKLKESGVKFFKPCFWCLFQTMIKRFSLQTLVGEEVSIPYGSFM
jgi:hypothetical protein